MDSSSDEEVNVGEGSFQGDLEADEFAETIELIESNADELDAQVLDSIAEVEGAKEFPCPYCSKMCKSKGGLTRHRRSKHANEQETTSPGNALPPMDMETVKNILAETVEKLREENIYPESIIDALSELKPSEKFLVFVRNVFGLFCRKRNQDAMLAMFYGEIIKEWRHYFPPYENQVAINVLMIHLPQKLVAYHKSTTQQVDEVTEEIRLVSAEIGPLSYVCGYVLQSLFRKSKNSPHWNSTRSQELQLLLQSLKVPEDDEYIHSLSRGGLWTPNDTVKQIAKTAELTFRKYVNAQKLKSFRSTIPSDEVVDEVLAAPAVQSLWESVQTDLDAPISSECSKLALENFIKLYVRVRSFSYAKDIVNKYKLGQKALKKSALRKELKKN